MTAGLFAIAGWILPLLAFAAGVLPAFAGASWATGGGLALIAALVATPLVRRLAVQGGWVARPSPDRWHERPVALLGGIAIFGAVAAGVLGAGVGGVYGGAVWAGGALVFAAGLVDDLFNIRPEAKLVAQIGATALLLYAGHAFWRGGPFWVSIPLTFLWVIGITNAMNLIDGLDGLAGGITAVAATVLALLSGLVGQGDMAVVAAVVAGASLGFLAYNVKPARIFMGDCGSMFLGYMLAVLALGVQGTGGPVAGTLAPVVVMAVPIFDTTFVTVTRILGGRPLTKGGNDHTHHRLVHLGLSEGTAVAVLSGIGGLFGLAALGVLWTTDQLFVAVLLLGGVASVVFGLYLVGSRSYDPAEASSHHSLTERVGAVMQALAGGVYWKSVAGVVADLLVAVAAFIVAVHLRFGGAPPAAQVDLTVRMLPAIVVLKVVVFYAFGLYHGIWRHAGTPEVVRLVKASTLASVLVGIGLWLEGRGPFSLSVLVLDWMITTGAVGTTRFGFRALRQYFAVQRAGGRRTLVYGSGPQEMLLLRRLRHNTVLNRTVVGLIDAEADRQGLAVQGVEVLGGIDDLPDLCAPHDVDEVIVAAEGTTEAERQRLREACAPLDVRCQYFTFDLLPAADGDATLMPPVHSDPTGDGTDPVSSSGNSEAT